MSLEELNQKIYDPKYQAKDPGAGVAFTPAKESTQEELPHTPETKTDPWTESTFPKREKPIFPEVVAGLTLGRKIAYAAAGVAILLLIGGGFYQIRSMAFTNEKVSVAISAPKRVESGKQVQFKIEYTNKNRDAIENAMLVINHPNSFRVDAETAWKTTETRIEIPLGSIAGGTTNSIDLSGNFSASGGQTAGIQSILQFQPEGTSARFEVFSQWSGTVTRLPLALEIEAPMQAADSQTLEYTVRYRNEGADVYENLRIILEYPEEFTFTSANPRPTDGNTGFYIGALDPGQQGSLLVQGTIRGVRDDVKSVTARIGKPQGDGSFIVYGETEQRTRIVTSPLFITQTVNGANEGAVRPGEQLSFNVSFRNDGEIGLRDVILSVVLDPKYLDLGTLEIEQGIYQSSTNQILYKASDLPQLARLEPGEFGKVGFFVNVRNDAVAVAAGQKNVSFEAIARIDSPDVPTPTGANKTVASNTIRIKLLSTVKLEITGLYMDATYPNTGSMPFKDGEETTLTIHAKLSNDLNDITRGLVSLSIPGNIRYIGSLVGERETVRWNERAGELIWEIGTLMGGKANQRELVFRVGFTPDATYNGQSLRLVNGTVFTGREEFVKRDLRVDSPVITFDVPTSITQSGDMTAAQ